MAFILNMIISPCAHKLRAATIKFNYFLYQHAAGEYFPLKKDDYKERTLLNIDHALLFTFIQRSKIEKWSHTIEIWLKKIKARLHTIP